MTHPEAPAIVLISFAWFGIFGFLVADRFTKRQREYATVAYLFSLVGVSVLAVVGIQLLTAKG